MIRIVVSAVLFEVQLVADVILLGRHLVAFTRLGQRGLLVSALLGQIDTVAIARLVDGGVLVGAELATHLGAFPVTGGDAVAIALGVDGQAETLTILIGEMQVVVAGLGNGGGRVAGLERSDQLALALPCCDRLTLLLTPKLWSI